MSHLFFGWIVFLAISMPLDAALSCEHIRHEINQFKGTSPAGILPFRNDLARCDISLINGLPVDDYFRSESDVLLSYIYLSYLKQETHVVLLDYMIKNKRWDLLLQTLDMAQITL